MKFFATKTKLTMLSMMTLNAFFQQQKELSPVRFDLITPALPFVRIAQ